MNADRETVSATRRALFGGAVAASAALAVPAVAVAAVDADAELIDIGVRYMALESEIDEEGSKGADLFERFKRLTPTKPEALRVRQGDHGVSIRKPPQFHDESSVAYYRERIPKWEADLAADKWYINLRPVIDRGREILSGHEQWFAGLQQAELDSGLAAHSKYIDTLIAAQNALIERAEKLRATTLGGFRAKALIASSYSDGGEDLDEVDKLSDRTSLSLIRDLVALGTAS